MNCAEVIKSFEANVAAEVAALKPEWGEHVLFFDTYTGKFKKQRFHSTDIRVCNYHDIPPLAEILKYVIPKIKVAYNI